MASDPRSIAFSGRIRALYSCQARKTEKMMASSQTMKRTLFSRNTAKESTSAVPCRTATNSRYLVRSFIVRNMVFIQPPVQGAAGQSESGGRLRDPVLMKLQRLFDHQQLHLLQGQGAD